MTGIISNADLKKEIKRLKAEAQLAEKEGTEEGFIKQAVKNLYSTKYAGYRDSREWESEDPSRKMNKIRKEMLMQEYRNSVILFSDNNMSQESISHLLQSRKKEKNGYEEVLLHKIIYEKSECSLDLADDALYHLAALAMDKNCEFVANVHGNFIWDGPFKKYSSNGYDIWGTGLRPKKQEVQK